ncbi:Spc98 family-domain-containing protein [Chytridium lagenaria]|nr:Spc98 family-domain-containing protein [Chytridium lagenaria]
MSHSTLLRLLRPVAKFGEGVRSIESFLSRTNILSRDGASIGVLEAFSAEIGAVLKEFKETILGMEKLFRQRDANAALPGVSSLLSFIKSLSSAFWPLQQMIAFLHKFRLIDTVQSKITVQDDVACTILDGMYSEILLSENCGDLRKRSLYVHALLRSLRPCFMEFGLWYSGSFIPRDSVGLALKINKGVSFHEMEFWRTRYLILDKVPRVLKAVLDKIVLCGKYMELLRFFDVSQASKYADSSRILFEKFITMLDHPLRNSGALPVILPSIRKETAGTSAKSTDSTLFLFPELNIQMGPNNLKLPEPRLQSDFNKIIHFHTEDEWNTLQPFQLSFSRKFSHDIDPYLSQLEQELMKRIRRGSTLEERFNILRTAFLIKPTGIIELCDGLEELMRTRSGMEPYLIDKIFREALLGKIYLKELYGIEDFGFGFDENPGLPLISVKFFESLRITCELSWPLNALVTSESLQNYNLAASFQLQLFWVHRQLSTTAWRGNRNLLKSSNGDSSLRKRSILFQTMSSFCNSLLQFFCNTVIGGLSDAFSVDLAAKRGIDAIIGLHDTFVQDISRTLLKAIRSCLDECLEYVEMFRKMDEERVEMDRILAPLYPATLAFETRFPILYQRFQEQRRFIADTVRLMGSVGAPELAYLSLALSF